MDEKRAILKKAAYLLKAKRNVAYVENCGNFEPAKPKDMIIVQNSKVGDYTINFCTDSDEDIRYRLIIKEKKFKEDLFIRVSRKAGLQRGINNPKIGFSTNQWSREGKRAWWCGWGYRMKLNATDKNEARTIVENFMAFERFISLIAKEYLDAMNQTSRSL